MENKLQLRKNPIKQAVSSGQTVFGLYVAVPSPIIVELAGYAGFDFIRIDICHTSIDLRTIGELIRAAEVSGIAPMARINNDPQAIQSVLEAGVIGLSVPDVSSAEEARSIVRAVRHRPAGDRGMFVAPRSSRYGSISGPEYTKWANDEILLSIQIETMEAVSNVEEILNVPGIDMIQSGRGDLASSLGVTGQKNHPLVLAAEKKIFDAAKKQGMMLSVNLDPAAQNFPETVSSWERDGVHVITLGHDISVIKRGLEHIINTARQGLAKPETSTTSH